MGYDYVLVSTDETAFAKLAFENKHIKINFLHKKECSGLSFETPHVFQIEKLIDALNYYDIKITPSGTFDISNGKGLPLEKGSIKLYSIYDVQYSLLQHIEKCDDVDFTTLDFVLDNINLVMRLMVIYILGKDYYNIGCDTYTCTQYTGKDIITKFKKLQQKNFTLMAINAILVTYIILHTILVCLL